MFVFFFFFKQKTAYEMRISDWSSDVCSSDLAAYMIERAIDILAKKLGMDPVELRLKNFIQPHQFPYQSALGWEYDSGDYPTAMKKAIEATSYAALRAEQKEKRAAFARGETRELMGIGVAFFTEIVGAGPTRNCDILGVGDRKRTRLNSSH